MGSRNEKCPAVQMVLRSVQESSPTETEWSRSSELSGHSSPSIESSKLLPRVDAPMTEEERQGDFEILRDLMGGRIGDFREDHPTAERGPSAEIH